MSEMNVMGEVPTAEIKLPENPTPRDIAEFAVKILDAKKAKDIKMLYVEEKTILADYFVIATGNSKTQVSSLSDEVEFRLGQMGVANLHTEGKRGDTWILTDYGCVIVHVFSQDQREFYNIEKLYDEGSEVDISALITKD